MRTYDWSLRGLSQRVQRGWTSGFRLKVGADNFSSPGVITDAAFEKSPLNRFCFPEYQQPTNNSGNNTSLFIHLVCNETGKQTEVVPGWRPSFSWELKVRFVGSQSKCRWCNFSHPINIYCTAIRWSKNLMYCSLSQNAHALLNENNNNRLKLPLNHAECPRHQIGDPFFFPLSDPALIWSLDLKLSAILGAEQSLIALECKFPTSGFLLGLDGWNRMICSAVWWLRELSTVWGGRGAVNHHIWSATFDTGCPWSWVIAAPSCDLQPQSSTPCGRFLHPSLLTSNLFFAEQVQHRFPLSVKKHPQDLSWKFPDHPSFKMHWCWHSYSKNWCALSRLAEPVCEPDRWGVSDHREDHQPGRSEDSGSAGEGLWPHLFHHQQQTGEGQVSSCYSVSFIAEVNLPW